MALNVERRRVPEAGVDVVNIRLRETYSVEGIGEDTVELEGELEAHRGAPLTGKSGDKSWEKATVAALFTNLSVSGESKIFGPVRVSLNREIPSFGVVTNGDCKAVMSLRVTMPKHGLVLNSAEPVQLYSTVETVPPIGDERTQSAAPVALVDSQTGRERGKMVEAVVAWRDLLDQRELGTRR
jgi:hypothetical protein